MFFNSFVFLVFLSLVVCSYYALPVRFRKPLLLLASYAFYGYWDWRFCSLLLLSTVVDYWVARKLHQSDDEQVRKKLLAASLATNLGVLFFFKYFGFFVASFESAFAFTGLSLDYLHINIVVPVGISFYTFQTLSYTIDVYRRRFRPAKTFLDFAVFVSFFPQLVAGPIEKPRDLIPQLESMPAFEWNNIRTGLALILVGLTRKVLIGDTAGRFVDHIFAHLNEYTAAEILFAVVMFSVQIYADFSGYSIIAKGTAKLFGINLITNFRQPYFSTSITMFWRRWHISLSRWLKDYLYIFWLGGNRHGLLRTYRNLMVTMLLGGLWHGAAWTFVIWGALHGAALAMEKFLASRIETFRHHLGGTTRAAVQIVAAPVVYLFVLFAWFFFRAKGYADVQMAFAQFADWQPSAQAGRLAQIAATYLLATLALDWSEHRAGQEAFFLKWSPPVRWATACVMTFLVIAYMLTVRKPAPFIYFQF